MCQKQFAAPFGAFGSWPVDQLTWTRGARKTFRSSDAIARGFCGDCGTPLTFEPVTGGGSIALALCAFDDPTIFPPLRQLAMESRLGWLDGLNALPTLTAEEVAAQDAKYGPRTSFQHPDHDTPVWPPADDAGRGAV